MNFRNIADERPICLHLLTLGCCALMVMWCQEAEQESSKRDEDERGKRSDQMRKERAAVSKELILLSSLKIAYVVLQGLGGSLVLIRKYRKLGWWMNYLFLYFLVLFLLSFHMDWIGQYKVLRDIDWMHRYKKNVYLENKICKRTCFY